MIGQDTATVRVADERRLLEDRRVPSRLALSQRPETVRRARPRPIHKIKNLHSRGNIDAILHRECARCERNGREFCLVVIGTADNAPPRHLARLAGFLCRRARATDEVGWFDTRRLCIVLPDTTEEGAVAFVSDFTETANFRGLSPICNVLKYHGQIHSENERLTAAQIAVGIESAGQDGNAGPPRRGPALQLIASRTISNLLIRPLPWWKRFLDVMVGTLALAMAMPLMIIIAIAIKIFDGGPVFFSQRRAGLGGRPFTIYKFRTMVANADAGKHQLRKKSEQDGPAFKIKHDPRITRVGRLLRETSLDELPQLFNVIRGDMSLVGPRPLPVEESNRCATWHRRRLDVTPGLTCIWQVNGRSSVSFAEWIRMDRRYIRTRNLIVDLKLILLTLPAVLFRRGR
jgi:lipopolysaccharide/colanic/teichoic acid biosynthesis glycosyltransferase